MASSFIYIWLLAAIFSFCNATIGAEAHMFAHSLLRPRNTEVPLTATENKLSHSYFPKTTDVSSPLKDAEIPSERKTITTSGDVSFIALATHQPASGLWRRDNISTTRDHAKSPLLVTPTPTPVTLDGSLFNKIHKAPGSVLAPHEKKPASRLFDIALRHIPATPIQLTSTTKATSAPSTLQTVVRRHTGDPVAPLPSKDLDNTYAKRTVPRERARSGPHFHNHGKKMLDW